MKYIILIIVGMAGVVLGTYLGRRRKMKKEGRPFGEAPTLAKASAGKQDKEREDAKKKKGNLEEIREEKGSGTFF